MKTINSFLCPNCAIADIMNKKKIIIIIITDIAFQYVKISVSDNQKIISTIKIFQILILCILVNS